VPVWAQCQGARCKGTFLRGDSTISYEVKLPLFEGPLDLLLHLIEREELDITRVSLAQVTDQYLEYIGRLEEREVSNLVDFLVVASKLLLIKSRLLLPAPPATANVEDEDVGEDLVRQLIEYKRFKKAASLLAERNEENLHSYVRIGTTVISGSNKTLDISDVSLSALVEAVRQALDITPPEPGVSQIIPPITVSIHDKIQLIRSKLERLGEITFGEIIAGSRNRVEIIVTFLAMLELIRTAILSVRQDELFGSIILHCRSEGHQPAEEMIEPGIDFEP
jgi:segregation and condensation protein A